MRMYVKMNVFHLVKMDSNLKIGLYLISLSTNSTHLVT